MDPQPNQKDWESFQNKSSKGQLGQILPSLRVWELTNHMICGHLPSLWVYPSCPRVAPQSSPISISCSTKNQGIFFIGFELLDYIWWYPLHLMISSARYTCSMSTKNASPCGITRGERLSSDIFLWASNSSMSTQ